MKHPTALFITACAVSLLTACGQGGSQSPGGAPGKGPGGPSAGMPPAEVEVMTASTGVATITQELPGRLQAYRTAQVRARVEGIVEKRFFTEGSDVKEGTPLFRIDPRNYQAAYDSAKADVSVAKITVDRYRPLLQIRAISQQEFDLAEAKLKQAEAALTRARVDLENTTVPAPITGRIGRELVTEGALVGKNEATPLTIIEQLDPIYVNFTQSGVDVLRLKQSIAAGKLKNADKTKIELIQEDGSVYKLTGKLLFSDLATDPTTGSISMRAVFPNPRRDLLPGSFVRVRFPEAVADQVILVPQRAVQTGPQGQFVLVVNDNNLVAPQMIKTTGMSGTNFVVSDGLKGGEKIVVNGVQKARPGSTVKPVLLGPDGKPVAAPAAEPSTAPSAAPAPSAAAPAPAKPGDQNTSNKK
ncbi:efflux RND transporter periplasmic adaptor subunit [beta proteobacterium MWH-UniP1]